MEVWGWVLAAFVMGWAVKGLMDKGGCLCEDKGAKLKCGLMSDDLSIWTAPCRASVRELDYEGNLCIGWQANVSFWGEGGEGRCITPQNSTRTFAKVNRYSQFSCLPGKPPTP